ncbi:hypothetical protein NLG97_g4684 [Lecanicillium saksenae]|uniref:Uncharacterized protein n=1 Tax=Lecanicillium saksenae TaxID=468837 RepID=A0ACC1QWA0_9HYPO|nr:hypothetical protein NLG97_g4684 [Lecanicillium saksenae]
MNRISNKLHDTRFNGTLGKNSEFSGHWGDPNEAVDKEWHKWGFGESVKYASFSTEEFASMGMDLEGSAKFTQEYGGGYIGFLEISHKMHCLNVIRQAYHREYYEKPENRKCATWLDDRPITIKVHISKRFPITASKCFDKTSCVALMLASFRTTGCLDLESVSKWIEEHEVPPPPVTGYPMPAGSKVWPKAP